MRGLQRAGGSEDSTGSAGLPDTARRRGARAGVPMFVGAGGSRGARRPIGWVPRGAWLPVVWGLLAPALAEGGDPPTAYVADFQAGVGPEWSTGRVSVTPVGGRRFLGDFGNTTVKLALTNLLPHTAVRIGFDPRNGS